MIADPSNKIRIDDKERAALAYWLASKVPELAPAKRMELMALYLRGYSTDQIRKEHPVFSLGQIVHAKIVDRWDIAVEQYAQRLRDSMIDQVALTTMETARTLVDVLAAANHFLGVKARKYLETNNPADLPFPIDKVAYASGFYDKGGSGDQESITVNGVTIPSTSPFYWNIKIGRAHV